MLIAGFITEMGISHRHVCILLLLLLLLLLSSSSSSPLILLLFIIIIIIIIIIVTCQTHADVIRLSVFLEFRQKHPNDIWPLSCTFQRELYWWKKPILYCLPCSLKHVSLQYLVWNTYEIIHICTAVIDESEEWSSQ